MTQTESDPGIVDAWTANPTATALAAAGGLVIGIAIGLLVDGDTRTSGDEPPIRVKNGSIELEVGHGTWRQDGSPRKWISANGSKNAHSYDVIISPAEASSCPSGSVWTGQTIRFTYNNGDHVEIAPELKGSKIKTTASSNQDLATISNGKVLVYSSTDGFIQSIVIDGTERCRFGAKTALISALLTEF